MTQRRVENTRVHFGANALVTVKIFFKNLRQDIFKFSHRTKNYNATILKAYFLKEKLF